MLRKVLTGLTLTALCSAPAFGAEFQPMGALGIGGAGVARTYDAYAPYWNPAGLAFANHTFSSRINGGAGIKINSTMAENVDRIGKLDINELKDLNIDITAMPTPTQIDQNRSLINKASQFVAVLNDLSHNDGTLGVTADVVLGMQYKGFAIGGFSTMELAALPSPDLSNVRPGGNITLSDFATGIGSSTASYPTNRFFTDAQRNAITAAFGNNEGITKALESELAKSDGNVTNITPEQAKDALVHMGEAFQNNQGSLENNTSTLEYLGLVMVDIPISYGHQFDLGSFGKLGVGGSFKVIQARAYIGESQIVKVKDSGDIVKNITDHYKDSTGIGIDLGLLWRYTDWLNVGIVGKNLNSPEFDTPEVTLPIRGKVQEKIKVKPQVRAGVALDPFSWLTIAADLDLTENETILQGHKSRFFGGGLELRPVSWFKLRGGMYGNMADSEAGPVGTVGLTFGTKWVNLDIDGAAAFNKGKYKDKSYPKEARVQIGLNFLF